MAINKHALLLVFVIGISITGEIVEAGARPCTLDCPFMSATYMTCPSTGALQLRAACNCCFAPEGECMVYFPSGDATKCPVRNTACPLNLEYADYMTCKHTGDVKLTPTANCCSAPDGCFFHVNGEVRNCDESKPFGSSSSV